MTESLGSLLMIFVKAFARALYFLLLALYGLGLHPHINKKENISTANILLSFICIDWLQIKTYDGNLQHFDIPGCLYIISRFNHFKALRSVHCKYSHPPGWFFYAHSSLFLLIDAVLRSDQAPPSILF